MSTATEHSAQAAPFGDLTARLAEYETPAGNPQGAQSAEQYGQSAQTPVSAVGAQAPDVSHLSPDDPKQNAERTAYGLLQAEQQRSRDLQRQLEEARAQQAQVNQAPTPPPSQPAVDFVAQAREAAKAKGLKPDVLELVDGLASAHVAQIEQRFNERTQQVETQFQTQLQQTQQSQIQAKTDQFMQRLQTEHPQYVTYDADPAWVQYLAQPTGFGETIGSAYERAGKGIDADAMLGIFQKFEQWKGTSAQGVTPATAISAPAPAPSQMQASAAMGSPTAAPKSFSMATFREAKHWVQQEPSNPAAVQAYDKAKQLRNAHELAGTLVD